MGERIEYRGYRIDRVEAPGVRAGWSDDDGRVHLFDSMGDTWGDGDNEEVTRDESIDDESIASLNEFEWCPECLAVGIAEGAVVVADS